MNLYNKLYKGLFTGIIILVLFFGNYLNASAAGGTNALTYSGAYLTTITENTATGKISSTGDDVSTSRNIGVNPTIKLVFNLNVAGSTNFPTNKGLIKLSDSNGDVPITVWEIYDEANYPSSDEKRNIFITPDSPLAPGNQYTISIDGKLAANNGNKLGSTKTTTFMVSSDTTPPALTISQPANSSKTTQDKIMVSGATEAGSIVKINDNVITVNGDGSFNNEVTLTEGLNNITITSTDSVGNTTVSHVSVSYDKPAPASVDGTNTDPNGGSPGTTENTGTNTVTNIGTVSNIQPVAAPAVSNTQSATGEKLPNTATNMYNLLGIGILLIACGLVLFLRKIKHNA